MPKPIGKKSFWAAERGMGQDKTKVAHIRKHKKLFGWRGGLHVVRISKNESGKDGWVGANDSVELEQMLLTMEKGNQHTHLLSSKMPKGLNPICLDMVSSASLIQQI
jgi:hypothetical protein